MSLKAIKMHTVQQLVKLIGYDSHWDHQKKSGQVLELKKRNLFDFLRKFFKHKFTHARAFENKKRFCLCSQMASFSGPVTH